MILQSARQRKQVKYTAKEVDGDSLDSSSNQSDGNCSDTMEQVPFTDQGIAGDACGPSDENQANEPSLVDNSSNDYLFSGGGFCVDEDADQNGNPIQQVPSPTRASDDILKAQRIDSSVTSHTSGNDCSTDINEQQQENMMERREGESGKTPQMPCSRMIEERELSTGAAAEVGLRAMPALRRKRRKT